MIPESGRIAIVGVGGVFPGADSLDAFWRNILDNHSAAVEVEAERWVVTPEDALAKDAGEADRVLSRRACLIRDFRFDSRGFAIPSALLEQLDPLFHLALDAARQAIADLRSGTLAHARTGVVLGNIVLPSEKSSQLAESLLGAAFLERAIPGATPAAAPHPLNRYVAGLPGGVVAKALGLGGGSYTLDAACASSLYALKLAVEELRAHRADAMLSGGVSRPDCLYTQMGFSQLRALSPSGVCAPFDAAGDGLVVGEGAGVFVLKRLEDAERDGDHIYAVIAGIGLSNDIDGSLLAPSSEGQLRAMRQAYDAAGWQPHDVDLIECHGTGTPTGDGVEVGSLRELWGGGADGRCVLGSVKSNVGHLLTAAGAAGLMKTLFALRAQTLPPTANFSQPAANVPLSDGPFRVLRSGEPWPQHENRPRRAAVSAFGFGGINAHVLLEEHVPATKRNPLPPFLEKSRHLRVEPTYVPETPVAIVGMATRFGALESLRAFQEATLAATAPEPGLVSRDWGVTTSESARRAGLSRSYPGFYLPSLDVPLGRFRIPPRELAEMLPQQLLMLLTAAEAVSDAGLAEAGRERTGVFVGIGLDLNTTTFHVRWALERRARQWGAEHGLDANEIQAWLTRLREAFAPALSANRTIGALGGMVASRIARELRIGGPSFTLSSEETSGLRALEAGLRALQRGELDSAIVGAVDLPGDVRALLATHAHRAYGSERPRPFAADAQGTLPGEGAAAFVLKRLEDAERDGDRIYAVLRGVGAASGGGVDEPLSVDAYTTALERAYSDAGIAPERVSLLEAHASGDPTEDRLEASALAQFFAEAPAPVALGVLKAEIGHTGAASALAGVARAAISLYQEVLPAARPLARVRPELDGPFQLPSQARYWWRDREDGPRVAGVSAFGVDGCCVHVVLEGFEPAEAGLQNDEAHTHDVERDRPLGVRHEAAFCLEAADSDGLLARLEAFGSWLDAQSPRPIEAHARAWFAENRPTGEGVAVALVARDAADLHAQIAHARHALSEWPDRPLGAVGQVFYAPRPLGRQGKAAFVYPGSGNHYFDMGQTALAQFPHVARHQDLECTRLRHQVVPGPFAPSGLARPDGWESEAEARLSRDHRSALLAQVAHGALMTDLADQFGLRPTHVIGYSLGETAGFVATRTWRNRDLLLERMEATPLFTRDLAGECVAARKHWGWPNGAVVQWRVGVVDRDKEAVLAALSGIARAYLLIVNAPNECVVGGDAAAVQALVSRLGCAFLPLDAVTTVHCEVLKPVEQAYRELHLIDTTPPPGVRFYSGVLGRSYLVDRTSAAESIVEQALRGLDFTRVIRQAYEDGVRLFLEMGPRNSCTRMVKAILGDRPHMARSICVRGQDDYASLLRFLAHAFVERLPVDWGVLYAQPTRAIDLVEEQAPEKTLSVPLGGEPFAAVDMPQGRPVVATSPAAAGRGRPLSQPQPLNRASASLSRPPGERAMHLAASAANASPAPSATAVREPISSRSQSGPIAPAVPSPQQPLQPKRQADQRHCPLPRRV
ncbi:MAG TPA: beta-ketoacyl synthase N-terminal-like domain-containing protein, partial [Oscillatoriaceae cyanobacterium]